MGRVNRPRWNKNLKKSGRLSRTYKVRRAAKIAKVSWRTQKGWAVKDWRKEISRREIERRRKETIWAEKERRRGKEIGWEEKERRWGKEISC